jgi:6-phosphogluconolactonase (cycloisomerase 2 family)
MSRSSSRRATCRTLPSGARLSGIALTTALAATTGLTAFGATGASASPPGPSFFPGAHSGIVYTETNQVTGNDVLAYSTGPGGSLTLVGTYPTDGTGTGNSPGSQGGVTLGDNGTLLAVVNGGSDSVSVFSVSPTGALQLIEAHGSGGADPISATIHGDWVYVLNAGNATTAPDIDGFIVGNPFLQGLSDVQPLSSAASSPEEVSFSPDGRSLVVTEKASSTIDVFPVNRWGVAGPVVTTTLAAGTGPYGFEFTPDGYAVVSEAAIGAVATFSVTPNDTLDQVSQVFDGQMAPCWIALTADGSEGFTSNAHSGTISAFWVSPGGALSLISPAVQASPGVGDTDLAVGGDSSLYISDQPDFDASTISASGTLSPSAIEASGLPNGTFGLAATVRTGFGF